MSSLSDLTVLVVDDDAFMRDLLVSLLHSYEVGTVKLATDGEEALRVLRTSPVDLVIADFRMEPMDGLGLVAAIRAEESGQPGERPVILVTARSELRHIQAADLAGLHYVTKPISRGKLLAHIEGLFAAQAADTPDGPGGPAQIQAIVDNLAQAFVTQAKGNIEAICTANTRAVQEPERRIEMIRLIARIAHDIKGQGGSFGYPLMSQIAASLCDFCRRTPNASATQLELVAVHADAMRSVMDGDRSDDGSAILSIVETASRKYMDGAASPS